jgi:hypothetical protein
MDIWDVSSFWLFHTVAMNIYLHIFICKHASFYLGVELLGYIVGIYLAS